LDAYGDGSEAKGYEMTDCVAAGELAANTSFGGITFEAPNPPFEPYSSDGILGIGYSSISAVNAPTLIDSLVANGMPNCFSMCLGTNGGIFVLGGDNSQYYTGAYTYTPIINETYYVVQMNDFKVGGKSLGLPASDYGQTIVDSGTTLLIIPQRAFNLIKSIILNMCSKVKLAGVCGIPQNETLFFWFLLSHDLHSTFSISRLYSWIKWL